MTETGLLGRQIGECFWYYRLGGLKMAYVHDKKTMGKKPSLDKGFGISNDEKKRTIAVDYVIDVDRRPIKDRINKSEPRMVD